MKILFSILFLYLWCGYYLIHMQKNHNLSSGENAFTSSELSDSPFSKEDTLFYTMETKIIEGHPNYLVTSEGNIYNRDYKGKGIVREMKLTVGGNGYPTVRLGRKSGLLYVHRIVATALIPNPINYPQVNHKSGIKTNNKVENLEWCDRTMNAIHAEEHNLMNHAKGEKVHTSKLTADEVIQIRRLYKPRIITYKMLAERFGISWWQVKKITDKNDWKHI